MLLSGNAMRQGEVRRVPTVGGKIGINKGFVCESINRLMGHGESRINSELNGYFEECEGDVELSSVYVCFEAGCGMMMGDGRYVESRDWEICDLRGRKVGFVGSHRVWCSWWEREWGLTDSG